MVVFRIGICAHTIAHTRNKLRTQTKNERRQQWRFVSTNDCRVSVDRFCFTHVKETDESRFANRTKCTWTKKTNETNRRNLFLSFFFLRFDFLFFVSSLVARSLPWFAFRIFEESLVQAKKRWKKPKCWRFFCLHRCQWRRHCQLSKRSIVLRWLCAMHVRRSSNSEVVQD